MSLNNDKRWFIQDKNIWWIGILLGVVLAAYLCSMYLFQVLLIQGQSMEPNYHDMQFAIIDKREDTFKQGDVVSVKVDGVKMLLVKRIAACPGDLAQIIDHHLYVNNTLSEVYQETWFEYSGLLEETICLSEDEYLIIGDNIEKSKDSRYDTIGVVQKAQITGKIYPQRAFVVSRE